MWLGSDALAGVAVVAVTIVLIGASLTSALMLITGPTLYAGMGLTGEPSDRAALYGGVLFGGPAFNWLMTLWPTSRAVLAT